MPKHGTNPRGWITWLGLAGAACAFGALITLIIIDPGKPKPPPPPCQYSAMKVTVVVIGPGCYSVMGQVADSDDGAPWTLTKQIKGEQFSRLASGQTTIRIYENGNRPLAGKLTEHFQAAQYHALP